MIYNLEKKSNIKLNLSSIKNILTVRYDITKNPVKKLAIVKDFEKPLIDQGSHISEKLLTNSFKKINGFEKFSISLSGGIDSSLCLALLRKNFPKAPIFAISGVFENAYDESSHAKKVAEKFSAEFHPIDMESIYTNMSEIVYIANRPKWNTYNHLITKYAKKHAKNMTNLHKT